MSNPALAAQFERGLDSFIPFTSLYNSTTLTTNHGDLVRTWRLKGIEFETADPLVIEERKEALNTFIRANGSERVVIYSHTDQRKIPAPDLLPSFRSHYARHVHETYQTGLNESDLFVADLFITILYRRDISKVGGFFDSVGKTERVIKLERKKDLEALDRLGKRVDASLSPYRPSVLGEYLNDDGVPCSEPLEFQNYLLTGKWRPIVKPTNMPIYNYLGDADVVPGIDTIRVKKGRQTRFSQVVEIKEFGTYTYAGFINPLYNLDVEFLTTISYCTLPHKQALTKLDLQIHQLIVADADPEHIRSVEAQKVGLEAGEYSVGEASITIRVTADTAEQVQDATADVIGQLEGKGLIAVEAGLASISAYFSAVPGNLVDRARLTLMTSQNFAGFASNHNHDSGKATGNPWGRAVMPLKTESNRIVYLNLHAATDPRDLFKKLVPSCTVLLGMTGEGKTTLANMIFVYMQQFHNLDKQLLTFILDFKRGAEKVIDALDGVYSAVTMGRDTGYNPFKMDNTPDNIEFLCAQVNYLCSQNGNIVTTADEAKIAKAVRGVMRMDIEHRGFAQLLQRIPSDGTDSCIRLRLAKWAADDGRGNRGPYAWALDCEHDTLEFTGNNVFGIDGTELLKNPVVRTPILMYLLHRVNQVLGTRRVGLFAAEAFQWMHDDIAGPWLAEMLRTIRSRDGFLFLDTQMPSTILECPIGTTIREQSETMLFLPNPSSCFDEYQQFGMDESMYRAFKQMPPLHFMIKQGGTGRTATLDLSPFGPHDMQILAGEAE